MLVRLKLPVITLPLDDFVLLASFSAVVETVRDWFVSTFSDSACMLVVSVLENKPEMELPSWSEDATTVKLSVVVPDEVWFCEVPCCVDEVVDCCEVENEPLIELPDWLLVLSTLV